MKGLLVLALLAVAFAAEIPEVGETRPLDELVVLKGGKFNVTSFPH